MKANIGYYNSPIGILEIIESNGYIIELKFIEEKNENQNEIFSDEINKCVNQLEEYFSGKRVDFDIKIKFLKGTEFQKSVWNSLIEIPYGETVSYKYIAEKIGNPKAVRAVGEANNKNPIPIIIPCHRVIGKNGSLTGYAGGLKTKEYLLNIERKKVENIE